MNGGMRSATMSPRDAATWMPASSGCSSPGDMSRDALKRRGAIELQSHRLEAGDHLAIEHDRPAGLGRDVFGSQASFLGELTHDAAIEIDAAIDRVARIGRPRREINAPSVRGMRRHFAEEKRAVRRTQRTLRKTIEDRLVGVTEIARGDEGFELDFKAGAGQTAIVDLHVAEQKDAAVEQVWPRRPQFLPMLVAIGGTFAREWPIVCLDTNVDCLDGLNAQSRSQTSIVPCEMITADPPISPAINLPPAISIVRWMKLGGPFQIPARW